MFCLVWLTREERHEQWDLAVPDAVKSYKVTHEQ